MIFDGGLSELERGFFLCRDLDHLRGMRASHFILRKDSHVIGSGRAGHLKMSDAVIFIEV